MCAERLPIYILLKIIRFIDVCVQNGAPSVEPLYGPGNLLSTKSCVCVDAGIFPNIHIAL